MKSLSRSIKIALFGGAITTLSSVQVLAQHTDINIAIQPLGNALNQLSQQTGTIIIAPSRLVSNKQATAATGKLSVIGAVEQLLKGSGLRAHEEPNDAPTLAIELQETVYVTRYPNLDVFVLNSEALGNMGLLQAQARWLDKQLQHSSAQWRIVTMHHPVFSSCGMPLNTPGQDEPDVRAAFLPVFLKHNVDLVLQGHDHTYSRGSIGIANDVNIVASPATSKKVKSVFLTSVAGSKNYPQKPTRWQQYSKYGVTLDRIGENTPTYQIIKKVGNRIEFQSYMTDGELYDGFTLEKDQTGQNTLRVDAGLPIQRTFANTGPYQSHHDLAE
jgi:3',5'-cyclic AMP phosphodiesterase CpdA